MLESNSTIALELDKLMSDANLVLILKARNLLVKYREVSVHHFNN